MNTGVNGVREYCSLTPIYLNYSRVASKLNSWGQNVLIATLTLFTLFLLYLHNFSANI